MSKFIKRTVLFSLGLVLLFFLPSFFLAEYDNLDGHSNDNNNIVSLQTKSMYDSLDILFIGNSYCYSGVIPEQIDKALSLSTYNLGIATAGVEFYDLVLNDYLANVKQAPRQIYIMITPMTFSSKADNYSAYPIHRYLENPISNIELSLSYSHYNQFFEMHRKSIEKGIKNLPLKDQEVVSLYKSPERGFVKSDVTVTDSIIESTEHFYAQLKKNKLADEHKQALLDLTVQLKSKGINVVFFELPTNKLANYFSDEYLSDYENFLTELQATYEFISVNDETFSDLHYRNIDHMNTAGARLATEQLIEFMQH
jgi:hypothetical protein